MTYDERIPSDLPSAQLLYLMQTTCGRARGRFFLADIMNIVPGMLVNVRSWRTEIASIVPEG